MIFENLPCNLSWDILDIPIEEFDDWFQILNGTALIRRKGKTSIYLIPSDLKKARFEFDPKVYGHKIWHESELALVTVNGKKLLPNQPLILDKCAIIVIDIQVTIYAE